MADKEKDAPKEGDTAEKEKDASPVTAQELAAIEAQANADADAAAQNEKRENYPGFLPTPPQKVEKKSEYDQAVDVIKSGRAVQIGPNVYTRVEDLPPAHVLARGNIESQKRVLSDLEEQRAKLDKQIETVKGEIEAAEAEARKAK